MEKFQPLHFAIIFHSENVKYTHLLERGLPSENKQIKCGIFIIWDLDSFILLCIPLLLDGKSAELGTTLLGILPDGYSVWIRAKFQPRPQCVCWTAHCISGDHTGSISMFKSLCCPLSLSELVPLGSRSEVQQQRGTCAKKNTCCWAANYLSTSREPPIWLIAISRITHRARKKLYQMNANGWKPHLRETFVFRRKSSSYVSADVEQTNLLKKHNLHLKCIMSCLFSFILHFTDYYVKLRLRLGYYPCSTNQCTCLLNWIKKINHKFVIS